MFRTLFAVKKEMEWGKYITLCKKRNMIVPWSKEVKNKIYLICTGIKGILNSLLLENFT